MADPTDVDAARLAAEYFGWIYSKLLSAWLDEKLLIMIQTEASTVAPSSRGAEAMALELMDQSWSCRKHWPYGQSTPAEFTWMEFLNKPRVGDTDYRLATLRAFAAMKGGE